ncbi:MAG: hypothetical protein ABUT20_44930, partial [Bacteroidota bacterium]
MNKFTFNSRAFILKTSLAGKCLVIFLLFTGAVENAKSQSDFNIEETDSLRKYSYNISGTYVDSVYTTNYTATGFFTTINNRVSFVTANHVLSGCKSNVGEKKYLPETMNIYFNNAEGHFTSEKLTVNMTPFRDTGVCPALKYPDIASLQVPDIFKSKLYTI